MTPYLDEFQDRKDINLTIKQAKSSRYKQIEKLFAARNLVSSVKNFQNEKGFLTG